MTEPAAESPVGREGVLVVASRGDAGPGEVRVAVRGGTETFTAWSPEPLPAGSTVLVVGVRPHRTVDVVGWVGLPRGADGSR